LPTGVRRKGIRKWGTLEPYTRQKGKKSVRRSCGKNDKGADNPVDSTYGIIGGNAASKGTKKKIR